MTSVPLPPSESVWAMGSRTVSQVCRETGWSRQYVLELIDLGELVWFAHGGRGTRYVAWSSVVRLLERLHAGHGAGART